MICSTPMNLPGNLRFQTYGNLKSWSNFFGFYDLINFDKIVNDANLSMKGTRGITKCTTATNVGGHSRTHTPVLSTGGLTGGFVEPSKATSLKRAPTRMPLMTSTLMMITRPRVSISLFFHAFEFYCSVVLLNEDHRILSWRRSHDTYGSSETFNDSVFHSMRAAETVSLWNQHSGRGYVFSSREVEITILWHERIYRALSWILFGK